MGPDVNRIDTGGGRADLLTQIVIPELRTQLQAALTAGNCRPPAPSSAAEVMARMSPDQGELRQLRPDDGDPGGRTPRDRDPARSRLVTVDLALERLLVSIEGDLWRRP